MAEEKIPFGEKILSFNFPSEWEKEALHPNPIISFDHPNETILHVLENPIHSPPLHEITKPGQKVDIVLASPGGYPWDISLFQSIKTLESSSFATQEAGTIILVTECRDGLGPPDWTQWFELGKEEEIERKLRKGFTIPGFIALKTVSLARGFRVILVSRLKAEWAKKVGMIPASSIDESILIAKERVGNRAHGLFIPHGSFVLPIYQP